jgi:diguanylate cyclase (GGDEF)-like protein/PAS domain S-box-containing protein
MQSVDQSLKSTMPAARPLEYELNLCRLEAEVTRQRLVDFISTASDIMWETDAELRMVSRRNLSDSEVAGDCTSNGECLLGKTALDFVPDDPMNDRLLAAHWDDLLSRRPFRGFVHPMARSDGSVVWLEANGNPFFDDDGCFQGYRGTTRDVTSRKRDEEQIAFLARHDSLTSLPNRVLFRERLEQSLVALGPGRSLALLILDLDNFKLINDSLGHPVGDRLLSTVGDRLSVCVRNKDTVGRVGGDEFAIVQADLEEPREAAAFAQRIADVIGQPYEIDGHRIEACVTIGIALAPADGADPDQLLKNADIALYRAKLDNPGTWSFFEPEMGTLVEARRAMETELRAALANGELEIYYQPLYNVKSAQVCAFEALVRWRHPLRGIILPDEFIPLAEETGLIVAIGDWILQEACTEAAKWPEAVSLSVNLSSVQFRNRTPVRAVVNALASSGLAACRLELEITETVLMQHSEVAIAALHQLRGLGVRIAMDDFGTGYSSLSYLRSFPFDKIKIDRSFVQDLTRKAGGVAIVRAITAMGKSLLLTTTAEGVETMEQFSIVCNEGCTEVQGFFFSRPKPAKDIPEMLRTISAGAAKLQIPSQPPAERLLIDISGNGNIFNGEAI